MISSVNQRTGFYMIATAVMKELMIKKQLQRIRWIYAAVYFARIFLLFRRQSPIENRKITKKIYQ